MPAQVFLIGSAETGRLQLALVSDGKKGQYVLRDEDDTATENNALKRILEFEGTPESEGQWFDFVQARHSRSTLDTFPVSTFKEGLKVASEVLLSDPTPDEFDAPSGQAEAASSAWDDLQLSHPEFITRIEDENSFVDDGEDDDDAEDEALIEDPSSDPMLIWAIQTFGPIDPEGPNGWMLRAVDGEPIPEGSYISFEPPASTPSADPTEEQE